VPDDNLSAFIDRLLVHLRSPLEADLHAFAQDFQQQARAAQAAAVEDARAAERRDSQLQLDQIRDELEQVRRTADAEVSDIRRLASAEIEGARRHVEEHLNDAQRQSADALAASRRETAEVRVELERLQRALGDASRAAEAADRERAAMQQSLDEVRHAATLASEALSGVTARTQQIVDAIRAIDAAGSIGDVLERLAHAAKGYAQRSVLLMVRGSSLTAWRPGDFPDLTGASIPVDGGGLIARAVAQRQPLARLDGTPESDGAMPAFAADGRPRDAVALPIVLGGETVAILYADAPRGGTDPVDRRWPLALEVVTCYASRVIEATTLKRSAGLAATAHASRPPRESETASETAS
jgi:hypothetical protein